MNAQLITGILATVRVVLSYLVARQGGDRSAALELLRSANFEAYGLEGDALETALLGRAALTYLTQRGVIVDEVVALIELVEAEGRDVTTEEVQEQLDLTAVELDETQDLID